VQESYTLSSDLDIGESFDYSFTQREDFSAIANYELVVFCAYTEDLRTGNDIIFRTISTLGAPQVDIGNGEDTLYIDAPITLSAEAGHAGYRWQDESTNSSYAIINPGFSLYSVEVTSFSGCSSSDEVYVSYDLPDIGITELPGIGNTCISEETTPMRVEVQNNGFFNLTSKDEITLSYYVNDESSHSETFSFSPDLPPGSRRTFEFEQGLDFSKTGNYNIRAVLSWEKDRQALNNDFLSLISVHDEAFINLEDGADTLVVNLPYMLSAGNTYTDYRWQDGSDQSNFWAYSSGTYWVEIVNEYGCSGSDTIYLRDILAARSMSADSEISIFPNPAQDYLNIQFENMEETELLLQLFNSSSQLLYKHQLHIGQLQTHRIPMQDLPPGIYTLNICHKEKVLNYKILKTTK